MITTYTAPVHFPGALTDCAAAVLQAVSRAGVWMVAPRDLNYDQLKALLLLRNTGYIEYASFGGYRVKEQNVVAQPPQDTPARIRAVLETAGITPLVLMECNDVRKRPGPQPSWFIELPAGARIPPSVWALLQPGCWRSGNSYVVQMK